jgi:multiple antibiotic resistance protein
MACPIGSLSVSPRFFFECLRLLLCAISPLAVAALFLASFGQYGRWQRIAMARTACWVALGLLVVFALWGNPIMDTLGVGISSFRVACGFVLAAVGFRFLCSSDEVQKEDKNPSSGVPSFAKKRPNMAVVPLAIPLIAGPDSLAVAMGQFQASSGFSNGAALFLAIAVSVALVYLCLSIASLLCSALSLAMRKLFFRIGGLLLLAIAAQQVLLGLREIEPVARLFTC